MLFDRAALHQNGPEHFEKHGLPISAFVLLFVSTSACVSALAATPETAHWAREAGDVTIVRDDWGIAHIYGNSDAGSVFGAVYAQAEGDFHRVETNYIGAMGRMAKAEGEARLYSDLRM